MESTVACRSVIAVWGVGVEGICLNSQVGFRMGPKDFRYAIIQIHWNNPELKTGQTDSSGMRIYYTSKLRPNRGQIATVGQISISIPPGQPQVTVTGNCSGLCTVQLPPPIYITASILHMHTLGKSGVISLRQNGKTIKVLDNVTSYDYNTPTMTELDTPVELKPGYEIEVKCVYDSTKRNTTTKYGEATSDEMCFGFIAYYPLVENLGFCGQMGSIPVCPSKIGVGACEITKLRELIKQVPLLPYLLFN